MIKIIKHGKKMFEATCNKCGCKFSYELEDIGLVIPGHVRCPECDTSVEHQDQSGKINLWRHNGGYQPVDCNICPNCPPNTGSNVYAEDFINKVKKGELPPLTKIENWNGEVFGLQNLK